MYIALEEVNFLWEEEQIAELKEYWRMKVPICRIADIFNRDTLEVFLLMLDLADKGEIKGNVSQAFYRV